MTIKTSPVRIVAVLSVTMACHDATGPIARTMPVPTLARTTLGAPAPRTYFLSSSPGGGVALSQYAYDTWVTLLASGAISLTALPAIPGASPYYVPGGPVGVTGKIDYHPSAHCVLPISLSDGYGALPSWGACEDPGKTDTVLFRKLQAPVAKRGQLPVKHLYDCSNTSNECHSINLQEFSTIVEQPISVVLNKLSADKRTSTFVTPPEVVFTASRTPSSLTVGGTVVSHPISITLWQWIGADSTRRAVTGYCNFPSANLLCTFSPKESGRMLVKAFTGGWEQTNHVTVQCLVSDGDSALNDSASDFRLRGELLELLELGHADSAPEAGWDASNPRGWRREAASVTWRLANGGAFLTIPVDDPHADACYIRIPLSVRDNNNPPVPGATVYSVNHSHPNRLNDPLYCKGDIEVNGRRRLIKEEPADSTDPTRLQAYAPAQDSVNAGSDADWSGVFSHNRPEFIVSKNGFVYKLETLDIRFWLDEPKQRVYRAFKGEDPDTRTPQERVCTWVKKYKA